MELVNATRMAADFNVGLETSGRELLTVVIKGSFTLPAPGATPQLCEEQVPLVMADTFTGEPATSAPLQEVDFAPRKRACDVLLVGSAYAPLGSEVTRMRVGLRVGPLHKQFDVVGDRFWETRLSRIEASLPRHFVRMPASYDRAFGGVDQYSEDPTVHDAYLRNPVGRGWHRHLKASWVEGTPLPNTEEPGKPVLSPDGSYAPIALGPLGRGWSQRLRFAGTYDQAWQDEVFPFLPKDFDERYYQAAPEDQQMPPSQGPMEVALSGFTPDGPRQFLLPHFSAPLQVFPVAGGREDHVALLDTLVFEPDAGRFTMSWRMTRPLGKSLHEIAQVVVGRHLVMPGRAVKLALGEGVSA